MKKNQPLQKSDAANAAAQIRKILRENFKKTKFVVHSSVYAGGSSIRIFYTDGPIQSDVSGLVSKFQAGHFDALTDSYISDNVIAGIPQVGFVFVDRRISDFQKAAIIEALIQKYKLKDFTKETTLEKFNLYPEQLVWRTASLIAF